MRNCFLWKGTRINILSPSGVFWDSGSQGPGSKETTSCIGFISFLGTSSRNQITLTWPPNYGTSPPTHLLYLPPVRSPSCQTNWSTLWVGQKYLNKHNSNIHLGRDRTIYSLVFPQCVSPPPTSICLIPCSDMAPITKLSGLDHPRGLQSSTQGGLPWISCGS